MNEAKKQLIGHMLHELILHAAPEATTESKYGGVLYTVKPEEVEGQFCGVFAYKNHVQLSFANGTLLQDPAGVLLGGGKFRRHVNFASPDEVDAMRTVLSTLLQQSAKL